MNVVAYVAYFVGFVFIVEAEGLQWEDIHTVTTIMEEGVGLPTLVVEAVGPHQ